MQSETHEIKLLCSEILNGYSSLNSKKFGKIFIRHFTPLESSIFDTKKSELIEEAKKRGLQTSQESEEILKNLELWDDKKNKEIKEIENYLSILKRTKQKQILQAQIDLYNKTISEEENKLNELLTKKSNLIGLTVETWSEKKLSEFYIYKSFFKDIDFKTPFFSIDDYNDLDKTEIYLFIKNYNDIAARFSEDNLKKISLLPYFYNLFIVSSDDIFKFYGKPILNLSFYQIEIFRHAMFFKKLFSESKSPPPDDILQNPERLLEWFNASQNAEGLVGNKTDKISGIAGATDEDYKRLGLAQDTSDFVDYFKEAQKHGGTLDLMAMAKLHQKK